MTTSTTAAGLRTVWLTDDDGVGDKPVVVFLHGLGDGADIWRPVLRAWPGEQSFSAVAFDLPGHGGSPWLESGAYSAATIAGLITDALVASQIDRPILIGHSLGARVALEMSADGILAPLLTVIIDLSPGAQHGRSSVALSTVGEHIDALLAGANSIDEFVRILKDRLPLSDAAVLEEVTRAQLATHPKPSLKRIAMPLDPEIKTLLSWSGGTDVWNLLGEAMCPVGVLRGEFSGVLDRASATRMTEEVIRCVANETIRKAGHAIALEQPRLLAESLSRIVAQRLAAVS